MERISYQDLPKGMFESLRQIEDFLKNSTLDMKLLELIRLRASQINSCAYCVDMHYKLLKHEGETELRLSSICVWEEATYFTDKERAVLKFTDALTKLNSENVSDNMFNTLLEFFTKNEISFLTLAISQINTWNRLMHTFKFVPGNFIVEA